MSPPILFTSSIGPEIARYVAYKQALGAATNRSGTASFSSTASWPSAPIPT